MTYPKILNKHFKALAKLDNNNILKLIKKTVTNEITIDMLIGNVTNTLLMCECMQSLNDGTYNFKKALLIRVKIVVTALNFTMEDKVTTAIDKDGVMYTKTVSTITGQRDKEVKVKPWIYDEPTQFQDTVTLKGSNLIVDNNSTKLLQAKSEITLRVKEINPIYIDLYTVLLYKANKTKVDEPDYLGRLKDIADETKMYMGYEYTNFRKLDSNSRNYPLNRYGFAVEYGDSFEKFLIEPAKEWLVTKEEVEGAIEYLKTESKTGNYKILTMGAVNKVNTNIKLLKLYNEGKKVNFTISHKELGELLHIIDVHTNIINNLGNMTRSCVSYDFTNSGGINAANQFGDDKFLKTMNLLGGDTVYDTHQAVADMIGVERKKAKNALQGPNHGGRVRVPKEFEHLISNEDFVKGVYDIFGETYKYIRMTAEYGAKLADKGIQSVTITRPDGVVATWYPYTINCSVPLEDGSTVSAIMPYGGNGESKNQGLAVALLHSSDAFTEAHIQQSLQKEGINIKTTLDNFYGKPSIKRKLIDLTFDSLEILRGQMELQLKDIEKQTGILRDGSWTLPERGEIVKSENII